MLQLSSLRIGLRNRRLAGSLYLRKPRAEDLVRHLGHGTLGFCFVVIIIIIAIVVTSIIVIIIIIIIIIIMLLVFVLEFVLLLLD